MKYFKKILFSGLALLVSLSFITTASALTINDPDNIAILDGSAWPGPGAPGTSDVLTAISLAGFNIGTELYKSEAPGNNPQIETGPLVGSYDTEFTTDPYDASGAIITYAGDPLPIATDIYMIVKDGNNSPFWYLFDLGIDGLNWNGTEELVLDNFWSGRGAISHISFHGATNPVPEPATMMLFGIGLLGLARISRKKL